MIPKNNWQIKKLGEICEVVGGGTPKTNIDRYWGSDFYWATPKDLSKIKTFNISSTERKISKEGLKNSSAKILPTGSVLLSSRAPIGYVAINTIEMATNQGCRSFICGPSIFNKYLYYFLKLNTKLLNSLGSGTTFKEISGSTLKEINLSCPSIFEQKRIVKILDEVFENIDKARQNTENNLHNSKELFDSYLSGLLINKAKLTRLEDVCEKITQGPNPKYDDKGISSYRVLKTKNLYDNTIYYDDADMISENVFNSCKSAELRNGDVLLAIVGQGSINKCNVFENHTPFKFIFTRALGLLRTKKDFLNPYYLRLFFNSKYGKEIIDNGIGGTSGQQVVTTTYIKNIVIPLPPLSDQNMCIKNANSLSDKTKKLEGNYKQKLLLLDELKKSVLAKAFAGEL